MRNPLPLGELGTAPVRRRRRLRDLRHVPILPSMITLGNLFFGFLAMAKVADAVMLSAAGQPHPVFGPDVVHIFEVAALLVFLAMVFDALDGTVARLTNQATPFGAQLDSLSDVVTFGVAPAYLTKVLIEFHSREPLAWLPYQPRLYYFCAAVYALCAAMRLARFNVESSGPSPEDHKEFKGLPSPAAAAVVCALVAFVCAPAGPQELSSALLPPDTKRHIVQALPAVLVVLGLLMVSRFPFPHLIATLTAGRHSFPFLATLVVLVGLAAIEWQVTLAALTVLYVAYGLGLGAVRLLTTGRFQRASAGADDDGGEADDDDDDAPPPAPIGRARLN